MKVLTINFNEKIIVNRQGQLITLVPRETPHYGDISFAINAPRTVLVNREEVYRIKKGRQFTP